MPREQKREMLRADLSGAAGHVAVVGSPRSGKSTLLRAMVTGLALTNTPREIQFYILDFGGGTFTGMKQLPHVAGLGSRSEPDVVTRIVAEVSGITDARENYFRANGIDTIETYRTRRAAGEVDDGYGDVFLVIDGWSTIRSDFDELEGELQVLAQRSLTFGVHLVTAATRWMDYRSGIRDIISTRFELRLGDSMDSEIDRKLAANIPVERPGRGIMPAKYHFLGALPRIDADADPATLGVGVRQLVAAVKDAWKGPAGPKLRLLPTRITLDRVRAMAPDSTQLLLGINEKALAPVGINVARDPHLLIFGDGQSGKSTLLRTYLTEVTRLHTPESAQIFLVDYRRANLGEFPDAWLADYATNAETASALAGGLAEFIRDRLPGGDVTPEQLRNRSWWEGKEAFVVVDDYELVATSQGNPLEPLLPLLAQAVDIGLHVVLAPAQRWCRPPLRQPRHGDARPGAARDPPQRGPVGGRPHRADARRPRGRRPWTDAHPRRLPPRPGRLGAVGAPGLSTDNGEAGMPCPHTAYRPRTGLWLSPAHRSSSRLQAPGASCGPWSDVWPAVPAPHPDRRAEPRPHQPARCPTTATAPRAMRGSQPMCWWKPAAARTARTVRTRRTIDATSPSRTARSSRRRPCTSGRSSQAAR